ncbi:MAG: peptidylprolyl isomerase [Urechidicola sp.]|nr:peptidylprolyl isomerase [Urechidicola sp.]
MIFKNFLVLFAALLVFNANAQSPKPVLFTIDDSPVYTAEFLRVYQKNLDILTDESQKDMDNYLDLFVNYKLKVQQARDLGYDTLPSYIKELGTYKKQLMEPYLKDDSVVEGLVQEAYERSLKEISASHILVLVDRNKPNDTIAAYKKINKARTKIVDGIVFEEVASEYSEDPSVKKNRGSLGYFTVFNMVYPFENATYTTEIGNLSKPFRTKFGYHIVKVNDIRDALGEVEAAHIMIKGDSLSSKTKINEIYKQLEQGEDFAYLAKTQSEDKYSAQKEGSLGRFGTGKMVKEFETVAFALKNEGDYSEPFKSPYGWHIIKLIHKFPVADFEASKKDLEAKVKRSDRSRIVSSSIVTKLKKEYKIEVNQIALDALKKENLKESTSNFSETLLTINGKQTLQKEFINYLKSRSISDFDFEKFVDLKVLEYYKNYLETSETEYSNTYKEYEEGLLLFELLQNKIWDTSKDSIGVQTYYDNHKKDFVLEERFEGIVAACSDKKSAKKVMKQFGNDVATDEIKKSVNTEEEVIVIFKSGTFNMADELIPADYSFAVGVSKIYKVENKFVVIKSDKILKSEQQELADIRGKVISDYQEQLEKLWIEELNDSYVVKMNESEVESIIK